MKKLLKNKIINFIFNAFLVALSGAILACGLQIFITPNGFLSTGFTGISLLIGRIVDSLPFREGKQSLETQIGSILYLVFNIPILILSWKKLSRRFTYLTIINVLSTSITLYLLPDNFNEILHLSVSNGQISYLSAAVFVGMINGVANAFAYVFGGSSGGTDIISMYYSIIKQSSVGKITILMNIAIIFTGMLVGGLPDSISKALYTLVYVVISSIVIDLFYVRNKRSILLVTTTKGKEVSDIITQKFVRGATLIDSKGAFTHEPKDLLYCACASFEVNDIVKTIKEIDEHAFISVLPANKVIGNFINRELR